MSIKNSKSRKAKQKERRIRQILMTEVKPLLDSLEGQRRALDEECEIAFEKTGFGNPHQYALDDPSIAARIAQSAYEILPHQYVTSKLWQVDELIYGVQQSIESGSFKEIMESLQNLQKVSSTAFAEVKEFVNSPLAKVTRLEWEEQPSWDDWKKATSQLNWYIGEISMIDNLGFGNITIQDVLAQESLLQKKLASGPLPLAEREQIENAIRN